MAIPDPKAKKMEFMGLGYPMYMNPIETQAKNKEKRSLSSNKPWWAS